MSRSYLPFEDSLFRGRQAEERVRDILCNAGGFVSKFHNTNQNDFQLIYQNQTHRVEIKNEDNYANSGNICLEVMQGRNGANRPSGIAVSEASILIHTFQDHCAVYRRSKMAERLRSRYVGKEVELRNFGDNGNRGFVLPVSDFWHENWFDWIQTTSIAKSKLWEE